MKTIDSNGKKPAISFRNVTKTYTLYKNDKMRFRAIFFKNVQGKKNNAISNVSFDIEPGEMVALFGRNGAGKSTLLRMLTREEKPNSGKIVVGGIDYDKQDSIYH